MTTIQSISALEVLDSRGTPTIQVTVTTSSNIQGSAKVPSGASKGAKEALELRDEDKKRYFGKGVLKAIRIVEEKLQKALIGMPVDHQESIDKTLIELDKTSDKSHFGANSILGVSLATARAAARSHNVPLYRYLGGCYTPVLPIPLMNVLNGGAHADNLLDIQEFMIRPQGAPNFHEALRWGCEVYHTLKHCLREKGEICAVGDEGGFAPNLDSTEAALDFLMMAIEKAGFKPGKEISLALDFAASSYYDKKARCYRDVKRDESRPRTTGDEIERLVRLARDYPITSMEDPLDEEDWEGWIALTKALGEKLQIVGDDLLVTHPELLERAIQEKAATAILMKPNQIGTLTETLLTFSIAKKAGFGTIPSHRSGETEDDFLADLTVALGAGQIKCGAPCRGERTAKYNRLLEIEQELGNAAVFHSLK